MSDVAAPLPRDPRPHLRERCDHAAHRALAERLVADQGGREPLPGEEAAQEANRRARVAAVDRLRGRAHAEKAGAGDHERLPVARDRRAECTDRLRGASVVGAVAECISE